MTESDSDLNRTSTPLRKRAKTSATPQWRKIGEELRCVSMLRVKRAITRFSRLLLTSSSSESDDDIEIIGAGTSRESGDPLSLSERNHYKRKNGRAKSRSLTPPPDIPPAVIANARNIVRHVLITRPDTFDCYTILGELSVSNTRYWIPLMMMSSMILPIQSFLILSSSKLPKS